MVSSSDFISLEYTQDLAQAGVLLTHRSLSHLQARETTPTFPELRNQVASSTLALAFRRLIYREKIPHQYLETTPFSDPEHRDITIGGHKCNLIHTLISQRTQIRHALKDSDSLLSSKVYIPGDQTASVSYNEDDINIFAFLFGLVTPNLHAIRNAQEAKQPVFLIHHFPPRWQSLEKWATLGRLVVKNNSKQTLNIQVCGHKANRGYQSEFICLSPGDKRPVSKDYYSLNNLHIDRLPFGRVEIHSPTRTETHRIRPVDWGNLWIYGTQIKIVGYLTCGGFRMLFNSMTMDEHDYRSHHKPLKTNEIPVA